MKQLKGLKYKTYGLFSNPTSWPQTRLWESKTIQFATPIFEIQNYYIPFLNENIQFFILESGRLTMEIRAFLPN